MEQIEHTIIQTITNIQKHGTNGTIIINSNNYKLLKHGTNGTLIILFNEIR